MESSRSTASTMRPRRTYCAPNRTRGRDLARSLSGATHVLGIRRIGVGFCCVVLFTRRLPKRRLRPGWFGFPVVALLLAAAPVRAQIVLPLAESIEGSPVVAVIPPDTIPAIDAPRFLRGPAAASQMARDELVLGVRLRGVSRAYPLGHLSAHEIVNDRFEDLPVAVTW